MVYIFKKAGVAIAVAVLCFTATLATADELPTQAQLNKEQELQSEIDRLGRELASAQAQLAELRRPASTSETPSGQAAGKEPERAPEQGSKTVVAEATPEQSHEEQAHEKLVPERKGITVGPLKIGGAIRANYIIGSYPSTSGPSRGSNGGNFELDTFRLNADFNYDSFIGSAEYRWYNGYNFVHHVWVGYQFDETSRVEVGVTRNPFGPDAYGVSQSWFFDMHYYVGLADEMDLGIKYTREIGNLRLDIAYFPQSEWNGNGASVDSARYGYDAVRTSTGGYDEQHQANLRLIYSFEYEEIETELGASAQFGLLKGNGVPDGNHYAASLHMVNRYENWRLATQITRYGYALGGPNLVPMGAYDYAADVAAEAWVAAGSLSYQIDTPAITWLDYIIPYIEYSSIIKDEAAFNNSDHCCPIKSR